MTKPTESQKRRCHKGKKRYDNADQARGAMHGLLKRREKQGNPIVAIMQVYGCACGGFHVGSSRGINWDRVAASTSRS